MNLKLIIFACIGVFMLSIFTKSELEAKMQENAYGFSFTALNTEEKLPLTKFEGKVVLVVNTASACGFTPQYKELEELYQKYKDRGLVVLGVPSNDFGSQEPGTSKEIATFCEVNYGVTFPLAGKEVVSGKSAHPFYRWAKKKLGTLSAPKWNFHKILLNRKGELVDFYISTTKPMSEKITKEIEELLAQ